MSQFNKFIKIFSLTKNTARLAKTKDSLSTLTPVEEIIIFHVNPTIIQDPIFIQD